MTIEQRAEVYASLSPEQVDAVPAEGGRFHEKKQAYLAGVSSMKRYCSCELCCHCDEEYVDDAGFTVCELCNDDKDKWEAEE